MAHTLSSIALDDLLRGERVVLFKPPLGPRGLLVTVITAKGERDHPYGIVIGNPALRGSIREEYQVIRDRRDPNRPDPRERRRR
jgi:hypothetical protein